MLKVIGFIVLFSLAPLSGEQGLREEQLASKAGEVWKELSHFWEGETEGAEVLDEGVVLQLDQIGEEGTELPGGVSVLKMNTASELKGKESVMDALVKWPKALGNGEVLKSKFKVVGVKAADDILETTQLVTVVLSGAGKAEYNGRWVTQWKVHDDELVMLQNRAVSGQLVRLKQKTIFKEKTIGVLPKAAADDPELVKENFYWRERVPAAFEPDQFGETGVSIADVNGDGLEDVYLCQIAGLRNRLWLRQADGTLKEAEESGLGIRDNTCAVLFLDLDGDRDRDAVLTTAAGVVFFSNDGGGKFTEKFRLEKVPHGFGMAASDYDQDGDLDLYVCQYYGSSGDGEEKARGAFPHPYPVYDARNGGRNVLLRNEGDWKFTDVTKTAGLNAGNSRLSYACLWEDFDNDGLQDLFVVNDFGPNNYFRNAGQGKFEDRSNAPGVRDGGFGMGMTAADFDHDGRYDIHISNMYSGAGNRIANQDWFHAGQDEKIRKTLLSLARGNTFLKNLGGTAFEDRSVESGIAMGRWSWSSLAVDLNNDTREDLLVANGFVTGKDPDNL